MRLDRFITLNIVRPWRRMFSESGSPKHRTTETPSQDWAVPVLMYHNIIDDPEPGIAPYYKVNTSPKVFAEHMQFLADHGYKTITISELVNCLVSSRGSAVPPSPRTSVSPSPEGRAASPRTPVQDLTSDLRPPTSDAKRVVITFDDGFSSVYTEAFPVLKKHGFTATVFLATAFIGDERREFKPAGSLRRSTVAPSNRATVPQYPRTTESRIDRPTDSRSACPTDSPVHGFTGSPSHSCLTWTEVREMSKYGIEFGSHTVSHPKLVDLDWAAIAAELRNSKSDIEENLGLTVTSFCYPYAFPSAKKEFVSRLRKELTKTGYDNCSTTELGWASTAERFLDVKRLPVNSFDDSSLLQAKLLGDYNYLGKLQSSAKVVKTSNLLRKISHLLR